MRPRELEAEIWRRWNFEDPVATYDVMTAAADGAPAESAEHVIWRTQAARALGLQRRLDEAAALLDAAAEMAAAELPEGTDETLHANARIAIERGRVLNSAGDPAAARSYFERALDAADEAGSDGLVVDALHMLAIVAGKVDSPEAARQLNEQAIERADVSDDPDARRWRASLLNNLGWDLHDAGSYDDALLIFEQALAVRREERNPEATRIASWSVARTLRSLERYDDALAIQQSLAASPEGTEDGYVHEEIGELLLATGRPDAPAAFARAHALLSRDEWLMDNERDRLERLSRLAQPPATEPPATEPSTPVADADPGERSDGGVDPRQL